VQWFDLWRGLHLERAYRSLRLTSTAGDLAASRIGRLGRALSWSGPVLAVVDVVLVVLLLVVVILNPRS
jgi:hypothetical protein